MADGEDQLTKAVNYCRDMTKDFVPAKRFHRLFFNNKILGKSRFLQILNNPSEILTAHDETKREFQRVYRNRTSLLGEVPSLHQAIATALDVHPGSNAERYVGRYVCYRKSDAPDKLVRGYIKIVQNDGQYHFEHRSEQRIGARKISFRHRGPVFVLSNRIYLLGIGNDEPASYVRPIILKAVDDPKKQELIGIVLTETTDNVPLASKTVLVHFDLVRKFLKDSKDGDRQPYYNHIHQLLQNESSQPKDIIYGWSRRE